MRILIHEMFNHTYSDPLASSSRMMNKQLGQGVAATTRVKEGIYIMSSEVSLNQDTSIIIPEKDELRDFVWISVCLSGSMYMTFQNREFHLKTGHSCVHVGGQGDACLKENLEKANRFQMVGVLIHKDAFSAMTGRKPDEIYQLSHLEHSRQKRQVPPAMRNVAKQLLGTDFKGADAKLFLEAKVLEFVAYRLGILDDYRSAGRKPAPVYPSLHERVHHAAELLKKRMHDPPGIFDLSRSVGLDHTVLTRGFKDIFGHTPFEYLSKIRLRKAAKLIGSREQNVTEASFSVGYSNLSHFAKIFRHEFGVNPKEYAKLGTMSKKTDL